MTEGKPLIGQALHRILNNFAIPLGERKYRNIAGLLRIVIGKVAMKETRPQPPGWLNWRRSSG